jgi:hypothetical protein
MSDLPGARLPGSVKPASATLTYLDVGCAHRVAELG